MNGLIKNFLIFFLTFILIASIFSFFAGENSDVERVGVDTFITQVNNDEVASVVVEGTKMKITLKNGDEEIVKKEVGDTLSSLFSNLGVEKEKVAGIKIEIKENEGAEYWALAILPYLLPLLLIGVFIYIMMRGVQGANSKAMMFGQSKAKEFNRDAKNKTTFKDVAGVKEAKEELSEVVEFLKQPKKFLDMGARIPRGVLLLGGPGVGKTLLARSVAGEADVPFYHISGSEFVEMFVGVGASRVRDLFKNAKKNAPCIIFIDEIDAVGRRRGSGMGGSHDEREQTLNQILVEMDGFDINANVIVMAATNRPDVLDPALLRPGRFDRQVILDNPDIEDREAILKIHARKKPLGKDVSLRRVAERTPGFSGADLANLLNESAILTARKNKKVVGMKELFDSIEKVMLGPERKTRVITESEKKVTAYHEAGHALVAHLLPHIDPVQKISIISRGRAAGYVLKVPVRDKRTHTKTEFIEEMAVGLAGFLTEKFIFGEVTTGATSDLRHVTSIAKHLITDYGMSEKLGLRTFGKKEDHVFLGGGMHEQKDYSEKLSEEIDKEIFNSIKKAEIMASEIIKSNKAKLEKIANTLIEKETIEKEKFEELMKM
jgi:cell division protease FtsH